METFNLKKIVCEAELAHEKSQLEALNMKTAFLTVAKRCIHLDILITRILHNTEAFDSMEEIERFIEANIEKIANDNKELSENAHTNP